MGPTINRTVLFPTLMLALASCSTSCLSPKSFVEGSPVVVYERGQLRKLHTLNITFATLMGGTATHLTDSVPAADDRGSLWHILNFSSDHRHVGKVQSAIGQLRLDATSLGRDRVWWVISSEPLIVAVGDDRPSMPTTFPTTDLYQLLLPFITEPQLDRFVTHVVEYDASIGDVRRHGRDWRGLAEISRQTHELARPMTLREVLDVRPWNEPEPQTRR